MVLHLLVTRFYCDYLDFVVAIMNFAVTSLAVSLGVYLLVVGAHMAYNIDSHVLSSSSKSRVIKPRNWSNLHPELTKQTSTVGRAEGCSGSCRTSEVNNIVGVPLEIFLQLKDCIQRC